jgi:amino acid transporter
MHQEKLKRSIGQFGFALLALNGLIGAGIFALPAAAAEAGGFFSPWMFLIGGLLMSTVVLSFAMLASFFEGTGGPITYAYEAFGAGTAFQTGWLLYLGRVSALAANSNALVLYLSFFWPDVADGWLHHIIVIGIISILAISNILGVKKAMNLVSFVTFLKITPLLLLIFFGFSHLEMEKIFSIEDYSTETMASSMLLLVYAFLGFEGAVIPAGEATRPKHDIPRALIRTLIFTTILYVLIQAVSVSILPSLSTSNKPLSDVAEVVFGPVGLIIMTITASISIFGNLGAIFVAAPRMTYALGIEKSLPDWFAKVSEEQNVPVNSILFLAGFAMILAVTGSFVWLAIISSLARMIGYGICMVALTVISKKRQSTENTFVLPFGMLIPLVALVICIVLALQASWQSWLMTGGFIVFGSGLFYFRKIQMKPAD